MTQPHLAQENVALALSWDRYSPEHLDSYLVSEVEDPRINCQSILTRSLIVDTLWPGRFDEVINEELRFGSVLTWLLGRLLAGSTKEDLLNAVARHDSSCPELVLETFDWLQSDDCPVPDYISEALFDADRASTRGLTDNALDVFSTIWQCELAGEQKTAISLLEPACGSANDYRFMDAYGLGACLRYTGFDIATKNIQNAMQRCPQAEFKVLSAFDTGFADKSFEFLLVHDLFEHLSPAGLETALNELMRVTERQAWLHFFNIADIDQHDFRPTDHYHWNLLSLKKIIQSLEPHAAHIEATPIPKLLDDKFGFKDHYNPQACTLVVTRR